MPHTPEQMAREKIDAQLTAAGWAIQRYKDYDPSVGQGIALIEVPVKVGSADYLLLVDKRPVGVIEAKKEGTTLSGVADQSGHYGDQLPDFLATNGPVPFHYESTGVETYFRDERDPSARSRRVFTFHRPETLGEWIAMADTLRKRLAQMPFAHPLARTGMRDCQFEAITNLEQSFVADRPRALIQMATGAGKTFTACAFTYRRIELDRASLALQAKGEFDQFITPDVGFKLTEEHRAEIAALQILYSRPHKQRLTEPMLKELEKKLRDTNAAWNEETLWRAFASSSPDRVKGRSAVNRFADLVPLVRFALEQQPVLEPFSESVQGRIEKWLAQKKSDGVVFDSDQRGWLELIRDHVATSLSMDTEDFEYAPFSQRGGLGKAHQLFGSDLPKIVEELNEVLAA